MAHSGMEYWRLADELTVIDAAILVTGNDPAEKTVEPGPGYDQYYDVQRTDYEGYDAVFKALTNAILSNQLAANVAFPLEETWDDLAPARRLTAVIRNGGRLFKARSLDLDNLDGVYVQADPNWHGTTIKVADLKEWLRDKGMFPTFFFPKGDPESFLNHDHPRYAAKLACAVSAWRALAGAARAKTPKGTILEWVAANGARFGLANAKGVVPQTAKEEIAKVVNWKPQGGAARTGDVALDAEHDIPETAPDNFVEVTLDDVGKH